MEAYEPRAEQPPKAAARTIGERLRTAREALGLELSDIAARTRIPQRHLLAVEQDAHENLPALTFAVGFAKAYAREVGIPPEEAAAQFRAETTKLPLVPHVPQVEPIEPDRVPSRRLALFSAIAVGVVILGAVALSSGLLGRGEPEPEPATMAAIQPVAPAPVEVPALPPAPIPAATQPAAAMPDASLAGLPAVGGPVTITATDDAWVKIYDRTTGQSAMIGILERGATYQVPPGDLLLWTGKAGALDIRVGDRELPPLGGPVESIKDVSLAPAALVARAEAAAQEQATAAR